MKVPGKVKLASLLMIIIFSFILVAIIAVHSTYLIFRVSKISGYSGILVAILYLFAGGLIENEANLSFKLFTIIVIIGLLNGVLFNEIAMYFWGGIGLIFAGLSYLQIMPDKL